MFRHEQKYIINRGQYEEIRRVVKSLMESDPHAGENGEYMIRSLYFDDMYMSAYNEKMDGVYKRKKYRIRIYNCSDDVISLECKHKEGAYIYKEAFNLSKPEYKAVLNGDYDFLLKSSSCMAAEFFIDSRTKLLKPQVIVDYEREPYVFDAGTVRITFDKNVRACNAEDDIFSCDIPSYNVFSSDDVILEIKYTGYLPEHIRRIFKVRNFTQTSASKYCLCVDRLRGKVML